MKKGSKHSEETKQKIRMTSIGRKLSEETKQRMSTSHKGIVTWIKGKKLSEEHKRKIGLSNKGKKRKPFSEETKQKMSIFHIGKYVGKNHPMYGKGYLISAEKNGMFGKKHSEETKKKMSHIFRGHNNPFYGKHHSEKTKKILSLLHKGKKLSEEHKRKIGLSQKGHKAPGKGFTKERRKKFVFPKQDTSIEIKIQKYLSDLYIEYVAHKYISEISHKYQCDIFIPQQETEGIIIPQKTIIECDGCYWHGCHICMKGRNNMIDSEIDKIRTQELINKGFKVIRLWEHDIRKMELNEFKERIDGI